MALSENPTLNEIIDEIDRLNNLIVDRGGAKTITPKSTNQVLPKGFYKGDITVKGDTNLIAANILNGKSIFGVVGNVIAGKRWASGTGAITSNETQYFSDWKTIVDTIPYPSSASSFRSYKIPKNSIGFTPSILILMAVWTSDDEPYTRHQVSTCYKHLGKWISSNIQYSGPMSTNQVAGSSVMYRAKDDSLFFYLPISDFSSGYKVTWYAFE